MRFRCRTCLVDWNDDGGAWRCFVCGQLGEPGSAAGLVTTQRAPS